MFDGQSNSEIIQDNLVEYADWKDEHDAGETDLGFFAWLEIRSA